MLENNKKFTFGENAFSIIVILLPFLYQYAGILQFVSLGETLLFPFLLVYSLSFLKRKVVINKWALCFYGYVIFSTILCSGFSYFDFSESFTLLLRLFFYGLLIYIAKDHFNWKFAKRIYGIFVVGFSLYLILQYIYNRVTGNYLPVYFKYDLIFSSERRAIDLASYYNLYGFRPSSLFLEPSYFTLFVLPYVSIRPFKNNKRIYDNVSLVIVIVALYLSGSGSGIIGIAIVLIMFLFSLLDRIKLPKVTIYILIFFIAFLSIIWFVNYEFENTYLSRIQNGGSIDQRVTRGIIVYDELPIFHKVFGVGLNNIEGFMNHNNVMTQYDESNKNYMSSIIQTANFSGLIGIILLVIYLSSIWKDAKYTNESKTLFCILLFVLFYESLLFSYRFAFLYIILHAVSEKKDISVKLEARRDKNDKMQNNIYSIS